MQKFSEKKVFSSDSELIRFLREAREKKNLELEEVASKTGIRIEYLEGIEKGDFSVMPEGLYVRNYIKQYAQFLGINDKDLFRDFQAEKIEPGNFSKENLFTRKTPGRLLFFTIPKIFKNFFIILLIFLCLFYVAFSIWSLISPPDLLVTNPPEDTTVNSSSLIIQGKTEKEAEVFVNNELVLINENAEFEKTINLKKGINIITIISEKKYSKKSVVERKVIFN